VSKSFKHEASDDSVSAFAAVGDGPKRPAGTTTARCWNEDGSVRTFSKRSRIFVLTLVVFMGGILAVGPASEFPADREAAARLLVIAVASITLAVSWRLYRLAIVIKPGRVVVRNMAWTHRFSVDKIERFDPPKRGLIRQGVRVVHKSGAFTSATAFTAMTRTESSDRGVYEAAELNAWLRAPVSPPGELKPWLPLGKAAQLAWIGWIVLTWVVIVFIAALVASSIVEPYG